VDRQEIVIAATSDGVEDGRVNDTRTVAMVVFDDHQLLDLAGPADVFATATLLGATPGYRVLTASPDGAPVATTSAIRVAPDTSTGALAEGADDVDTLMVVGGLGVRAAAEDARLRDELRFVAGRSRRITSVCSGALLLAASGLLDGHAATTHWASCDELAAAGPRVHVERDRIFVRDRDRWTSAGVTAGIDLALALVEDDHGPDLAHQVAAWLVVFVRRPGGQSQFSSQLVARPARHEALRELQRWIPEHVGDDLAVATLAARAHMSERTFVRSWHRETGTTPAAYVESVRVEAARRLLESTDMTVDAVARAVGLRRAERLHRAVRRQLGTTPGSYRAHFARAD
jgi:transcriptional regulator GlxA family with amidase domain